MKHLTNDELNAQLKSLVQQEREILSQILLHIQEVDRRRLYLKLAYSSLFSYLTDYLGYSAGSAQRRIDAARLIQDVPQLPEKLESGNLNLSQISLVQKALRQKKTSVPREQKQELLQKLQQAKEILSHSLPNGSCKWITANRSGPVAVMSQATFKSCVPNTTARDTESREGFDLLLVSEKAAL